MNDSHLSNVGFTIMGNTGYEPNFRGEFDEQIDRNHGHYCGKYGNHNVLYLVLQE